MEQKRCVVCDELYDANLRICPTCFPDAQQVPEPEPEPEVEAPRPVAVSKPKTLRPKRAWKSPLDGEIHQPTPHAQAIRTWTDRITLCIVAFVAALDVVAVLGFLLGQSISPATVVLAALASSAAVAISFRRHAGWWWRSLIVVGVCALLLVAACSLTNGFYDTSYDGQAYQGAGVIRLASGWNPFADVEGESLVGPHTIWHVHFPKGPWYESAAIYRLTGRLEAAKGVSLFLAFAALAFCFGVFSTFERIPRALAGALAFMAAFHPIVILQTFTLYVDGRTSAWLTILIVALLDMALRAEADLLMVTLASIAVAAALNIKFTATAYVLILLLGGAIVIYTRVPREQFWRAARIIGAAALFALLVVGWTPYITNTIAHRSPFYPASGRGSFPIVAASMMPADFATGNRVSNLYRALFGQSDDPFASKSQGSTRSQMKLPFTIQPSEWEQFNVPDQRIGEFGPLFGGAILLAVVTAVAVLATGGWRSSTVMITLAFVGLGIGTVLLNPQAWIVRYSPHLWLMVLLLAITPFLAPSHVAARASGLLACAVLLVDIAVVGTLSLKTQLHNTSEVRQELTQLAKSAKPVPVYFDLMTANSARFDEAGIRYRALDEKPADADELFNSETLVVYE